MADLFWDGRKEDFALSRPYEGDVSAQDCWNELSRNPDAFLVDVRTSAEWTYVGFPLLPEPAGRAIFVEWQRFPTMDIDPSFPDRVASAVEMQGGSKDSPLYFLCRSGVRSIGAASTMTQAGFAHCFNVLSGFEGPPDAEGHRGRTDGWKADNLPWMQK